MRLEDLEIYKHLCEKRIVELCPEHAIPVLSAQLGKVPNV